MARSRRTISRRFRSNGTAYRMIPPIMLSRNGLCDWALRVDGLVSAERFSLESCAHAQRTRSRPTIASRAGRHREVDRRASARFSRAQPQRELIRRVLLRARHGRRRPYTTKARPGDAYHPQTILAYALNGRTLPLQMGPTAGAHRRQLGYKRQIHIGSSFVESFHAIATAGGYWEDRGTSGYAGIDAGTPILMVSAPDGPHACSTGQAVDSLDVLGDEPLSGICHGVSLSM